MAERLGSRTVAIIAIACAIVMAAIIAVAVVVTSANNNTASSGSGGTLATAAVVRTDFIVTTQVSGAIGFEGSYTVSAPSGASAKIYTWLPQVGRIIRQNESVYCLNNEPVPLLYGAGPPTESSVSICRTVPTWAN